MASTRRNVLRTIGGIATVFSSLAGCIQVPTGPRGGVRNSGGQGPQNYQNDGDFTYDNHRYYGPEWENPPSRSNEDYVSNYNSLQGALSNVPEDRVLYLDTGPYSGSEFTVSQSNVTISGEGFPNAVINFDYGGRRAVETADWNTSGGSCDPIAKGDTTITGIDTGPFSVGDDAQIIDHTDEYTRGNPGGSGSGDGSAKSQFSEVASVGSNSITIDPPAHWDFAGDPEINSIDWGVENVHFTDFSIRGDGIEGTSDLKYRLLAPSASKNVWVTNIEFSDVYGNGCSFYRVLNAWMNNCLAENIRYYGTNASSGATNIHYHNVEGHNIRRYVVSCAMSTRGGGAYYVRSYDCVARNCGAVNDAHFGAENVVFYNSQAYENAPGGNTIKKEECRLHRMRGFDQHGVGGHREVRQDDGENVSHCQQWPEYVSFSGLSTPQNHGHDINGFMCTSSADSWGIDRLEITDCDIWGGRDPFVFRCDVDDLYVSEYYWNGSLVTEEDVRQSRGFESHTINVTVDNGQDQEGNQTGQQEQNETQ